MKKYLVKRTIVIGLILSVLITVLSGCATNVTDQSVTSNVFGQDISGSYTGKFENDLPNGEGMLMIDDTSSVEGVFTEGKFVDGTASNIVFPYDWTFIEGTKTVETYYTGSVVEGVPEGNGKLSIGDDSSFEGVFSAGKISEGTATNLEYHIDWTFSDEIYPLDGVYSGDISNDLPNGVGTYLSGTEGEAEYFYYDGEWKNGLPDGEGKLERVNKEGDPYIYTGGFANGVFNGHGKKEYIGDTSFKAEGNYVDGEFAPTIVEYVRSNGTISDSCEYTLTSEQEQFLTEHESMFAESTREDYEDDIIDLAEEFSYNDYSKNPGDFEPTVVVAEDLNVIQIQVMDGSYEEKETFMILANSSYEKIYYLFYSGTEEDAVVGDKVDVYFLPLGYTTYKTIDDTDNWAVVGQVALVE